MVEAVLEQMRAVAADPAGYLRRRRAEDGLRVVGYFCTYVQEELLHAAGLLPARIFGHTGNTSHADSHISSFACAFVRGCLEAALRGELDHLDAVVFPRSCDMIRALQDVWASAVGQRYYAINMPLVLSAPGARGFLLKELAAFKAWAEKQGGRRISATRLRATLAVYHRQRQLLGELYELRYTGTLDVNSADTYTVVKAGMIMPREEHVRALEQLLAEARPGAVDGDYVPVVLDGNVCTSSVLHALIDRLGGRVVDDNLCVGRRYFADSLAPTNEPPLVILGQRSFRRIPCPCNHAEVRRRSDALLALVRGRNARGVIFLFQRFCHPHYFEYPDLRDRLDREGIPHLVLETGEEKEGLGQAETRLQAFLEMIQ